MRGQPTVSVVSALAVCVFLALGSPDVVYGDAFRLLDHGAAAAGQGAAFAAQADDPSALYYNPAGMTQLPGLQVYFGTDLVWANTSFTNTVGQTVHGGTDGLANPPPSHLYITASLKDLGLTALGNLSIGLGVTSTFGLQVRYPSTGPLATVSTYAALPLLDIKPTAAYQLTSYLSFGAGLDIYTFSSLLGDGHAEQKRVAGPEFALFGIPPGSSLEVNGTDTAVGFNLSALITPWRTDNKPRLNLGLVYRSPVTLDLKGNFLVNNTATAGAEVQLKLPWVFSAAVAAWPIRNDQHEWKLEVDVDHADWSSFENLDVKLSNGLTLPSPQNWWGTYVVMVGTEYKWLAPPALPGWQIAARAGWFHSATPVPSKTFTPVVPDSNLNALALGLGLMCRAPGALLTVLPCGTEREGSWAPKSIGIDLAYQLVLTGTRVITDNNDPRVNGRWSTTTNAAFISLRSNF